MIIHDILYSSRRRDRWWRFNLLKDAYTRAASLARAGEPVATPLRRAFSRLGYGTPAPALEAFWEEIVSASRLCEQALDMEVRQAKLISLGEKLQPDLLPMPGWLDMYRLCLAVGFFSAGKTLRDHGLAVAANRARSAVDEQVLIPGFHAALEKGRWDEAKMLLDRLKATELSGGRIDQVQWLLGLLSGAGDSTDYTRRDKMPDEDQEFADLVKGKKLALVGPVPTTLPKGPEIDGFDCVVKFSYRGGEKGRDPQSQGRRIDISYYNNSQAAALSKIDYAEVLKELKFAVFLNRKGRSLFPESERRMRRLTPFLWLLPDTHFNAGPNALFDLLRFAPAGVHVFNTDLMLSAGRFEGYRPAGARQIDYTRSFIKTHDPVLQYEFMRLAWQAGCITGDQGFTEVMEMGIDTYLSRLQQVHGCVEQALL
ncbi:hypothetical protein [Marinobacter sp.]|uniref:hypothetical protein n=1 Tax=Marinobacter sp. TaxID=50741 RepID=UPI00384D14CC